MTKLEEKQQKPLQEVVGKINTVKQNLGNIELQKHDLLHAAMQFNTELNVIQAEIEKEYGNVIVDVATGEVKENDNVDS